MTSSNSKQGGYLGDDDCSGDEQESSFTSSPKTVDNSLDTVMTMESSKTSTTNIVEKETEIWTASKTMHAVSPISPDDSTQQLDESVGYASTSESTEVETPHKMFQTGDDLRDRDEEQAPHAVFFALFCILFLLAARSFRDAVENSPHRVVSNKNATALVVKEAVKISAAASSATPRILAAVHKFFATAFVKVWPNIHQFFARILHSAISAFAQPSARQQSSGTMPPMHVFF